MFKQKITKQLLENDIQNATKEKYFDRIDKFYSRLPKTKCLQCGICCTDSPNMSYIEFMYAYDYLKSTYSKVIMGEVLKRAVSEFFYGLVKRTSVRCACLDENTSTCMIYPRAPLACKEWGLQSEIEYKRNLDADLDNNINIKRNFLTVGIELPDETVDYTTPFCNNVERVSDTYRITSLDFDNFLRKDLVNLQKKYLRKFEPWSIGQFLIFTLIGESIIDDRINVIKDYQQGNLNAVDEYIGKNNYESYF